MASYKDFLLMQQAQAANGVVPINTPNPTAPMAITPGYASLVAPQQPANYQTMSTWGQPQTPMARAFIGADYEQMPMGTNGLAPNEGMFAGSAVNRPITAATDGGGFEPSLSDFWLGYRGADGVSHMGAAGAGLAGANFLMNGFLGMQQLSLAKDSLANSKAQFERNFSAQKGLTNSALETRQQRRVTERGDATAVSDYMNKYGVK